MELRRNWRFECIWRGFGSRRGQADNSREMKRKPKGKKQKQTERQTRKDEEERKEKNTAPSESERETLKSSSGRRRQSYLRNHCGLKVRKDRIYPYLNVRSNSE